MKRAAIYLRVSTEMQIGNFSIPEQRRVCQEYARSHDFEIGPEIEDEAKTGRELQRLDRVKTMAGKIDAVIVANQKRFSRADILDTWNLIDELNELGIELHDTERGCLDLKDPMQQIMFVVEGQNAIREAQENAKRASDHKRQRARMGEINPGYTSLYGYKYVAPARRRGEYQIVQDEAEVLSDIFHWYADGKLGGTRIADRLNSMGVPTRSGKPWTAQRINNLIKEESYTGKHYAGKRKRAAKGRFEDCPRSDWIEQSCPVIISPELWRKAQIQRELSKSEPRNTKGEYLLQHRLRCSICGRIVKCRPGDHRYPNCMPRYNCTTCNKAVRVPPVDEKVWDELADAFDNPPQLLTDIRHHMEESKEQLRQLEKRRRNADKHIADAEIEKDNWLTLNAKGKLSWEKMEDKLDGIDKVIAKWEAEKMAAQQEIDHFSLMSVATNVFRLKSATIFTDPFFVVAHDGISAGADLFNSILEELDLPRRDDLKAYTFAQKRDLLDKYQITAVIDWRGNGEAKIKLAGAIRIDGITIPQTSPKAKQITPLCAVTEFGAPFYLTVMVTKQAA